MMTLWRLEWLRIVRTRRLVILLAVFIIFGFIGPLMARYLPEIISQSAGDVSNIKVEVVGKPTPAGGFMDYISNVYQTGLIVVVVVAASTLAIDAKASLSTFYRTRTAHVATLLLPRVAMLAMVTVVACILGTLTAWYETTMLIGSAPVETVVAGGLYLCLYWVFAIAVVAFASSIVRSTLATVGVSLGLLLLLPLLGAVDSVGRWLPSALPTSMGSLLTDQHEAAYYLLPALVAVVTSAMLLGAAAWRLSIREVGA